MQNHHRVFTQSFPAVASGGGPPTISYPLSGGEAIIYTVRFWTVEVGAPPVAHVGEIITDEVAYDDGTGITVVPGAVTMPTGPYVTPGMTGFFSAAGAGTVDWTLANFEGYPVDMTFEVTITSTFTM